MLEELHWVLDTAGSRVCVVGEHGDCVPLRSAVKALIRRVLRGRLGRVRMREFEMQIVDYNEEKGVIKLYVKVAVERDEIIYVYGGSLVLKGKCSLDRCILETGELELELAYTVQL